MMTQNTNVFSDDKLFSIMDRHSPSGQQHLGELIRKMTENYNKAEMIIPVLGMQGMGKSTLINAILGENILPNDADETTCVPVEVKYGEKEFAEVFFLKSSESKVVHTREELNHYVDNIENPGNEKRVSHIVLYRKNSLLQSGLVIVDLPGVGSLTVQNAETTHRYIRNLCTAIFVIPTTPTLRKQELTFIKSVWTQFPKAIFVQNFWDENSRELKESVEYNTLLIKRIAKEINAQFDERVIVVQAYNALKGTLNKDNSLIESSKITELIREIEHFSANWSVSMENGLQQRTKAALIAVKQVIEEKICQIGMTREERSKAAEKKHEEYCENSRKLYHKISDVEEFLLNSESMIRQKAKEASRKCAGTIRTDMNRIIDGGVTDGEKLNTAFLHVQEDATATAFEDIFSDFMQIKYQLEDKLYKLEDVITEECCMRANASEFQKDSELKFEKSFDLIGGIGGGIGGVLAISAIGGPIGLIVGIGIGIVGAVIGSFAKKKIKQSRAAATKSEISFVIDEMEKKVYRAMINEFEKITQTIRNALNEIKLQRREEERSLRDEIDCVSIPDDEKAVEQQLKDDLSYVTNQI